MSKTQKSLIGGMTVLGIAGIVCKLVGVLYSIPLARILGTQGLGIFQSVFPTYNLLLTVSSAGLPVAVSRMVSHCLAKDDPNNARRVFRVALCLLTALGCVCTIVLLAMTPILTGWVNHAEADIGFRVIAPCVCIVCVLAAFRGFMQGQQNMVPTAVSQLIEQVGKVFISLPLAYFGVKQSLALGAAGALLGITIVEAVAMVYMILLTMKKRRQFDRLEQLSEEPAYTSVPLAKELFKIAIPITISACIVPLAQFVDSTMLVKRMITSGIEATEASSLYGLFSGMVIRLINIPTALALAVAMSLVPAIAAAKALEDKAGMARQANLGLRFAFLIGFPCSIGMSVLSKQILGFFYVETLSAEHLRIGGELLSMSALTVVLFTVVQATSSILQGVHKQRIPMYTLCVGVGLKIIMNYVLVGTPGIGIYGGPCASIVCYSASMIPNLYYVCKYTGQKFNWSGWILRPGAAAAVMGIVIYLMRRVLPFGRVFTILEIAVGVVVYVFCALRFKAMTRDDLRSFRRKSRA